jgi:hypothetical protein
MIAKALKRKPQRLGMAASRSARKKENKQETKGI